MSNGYTRVIGTDGRTPCYVQAIFYEDDSQNPRGCSLATLRGEFEFSTMGTRPQRRYGPIEAMVGVAPTTYDPRLDFRLSD